MFRGRPPQPLRRAPVSPDACEVQLRSAAARAAPPAQVPQAARRQHLKERRTRRETRGINRIHSAKIQEIPKNPPENKNSCAEMTRNSSRIRLAHGYFVLYHMSESQHDNW
jgi:hypothetical protein